MLCFPAESEGRVETFGSYDMLWKPLVLIFFLTSSKAETCTNESISFSMCARALPGDLLLVSPYLRFLYEEVVSQFMILNVLVFPHLRGVIVSIAIVRLLDSILEIAGTGWMEIVLIQTVLFDTQWALSLSPFFAVGIVLLITYAALPVHFIVKYYYLIFIQHPFSMPVFAKSSHLIWSIFLLMSIAKCLFLDCLIILE